MVLGDLPWFGLSLVQGEAWLSLAEYRAFIREHSWPQGLWEKKGRVPNKRLAVVECAPKSGA